MLYTFIISIIGSGIFFGVNLFRLYYAIQGIDILPNDLSFAISMLGIAIMVLGIILELGTMPKTCKKE